jgi:hypothetical protein
MAAAVQRNAIEGELQRFTLRVTRRTVPIMFSMMLVQASERRSSAGRPSLLTVRISSNPLEDALRDAGGVALEALGEIADQLLRLRRIVEFPGLAQRTPDRGMQSRR